jgi:hypothetical protein
MAMRVVTVRNALGSPSDYCAEWFLFGPPFRVYCRGEHITPDDRRSHVGLIGGRKSVEICNGYV